MFLLWSWQLLFFAIYFRVVTIGLKFFYVQCPVPVHPISFSTAPTASLTVQTIIYDTYWTAIYVVAMIVPTVFLCTVSYFI